MTEPERDALQTEIVQRANALTASIQRLPEGPQRSIALSQIGEAVRLAGQAIDGERGRERQRAEAEQEGA